MIGGAVRLYTDVPQPLDERIAAAKERSDRMNEESFGIRRPGLDVDWEAVLEALPPESRDFTAKTVTAAG